MQLFDPRILFGFGGASIVFASLRWALRARRIVRAALDQPKASAAASFEPLLEQRQGMVAKFVQAVRAAPAYDHEALDAVVAASIAAAASTSGHRADSEAKLAEALNRQFAAIEKDPVLGVNPELAGLKSELAIMGRRLEATPGFFLAPTSAPMQKALDANSLVTDVMLLGGAVPGALANRAGEGVAATSLFASKPVDARERDARYVRAVAGSDSKDPSPPGGGSSKTGG